MPRAVTGACPPPSPPTAPPPAMPPAYPDFECPLPRFSHGNTNLIFSHSFLLLLLIGPFVAWFAFLSSSIPRTLLAMLATRMATTANIFNRIKSTLNQRFGSNSTTTKWPHIPLVQPGSAPIRVKLRLEFGAESDSSQVRVTMSSQTPRSESEALDA